MTDKQCREDFEATFAANALDFSGDFNGWTGRYQYRHSHVDAKYEGFAAAWSGRPAPANIRNHK